MNKICKRCKVSDKILPKVGVCHNCYKKDWYIENKERLLKKAIERYRILVSTKEGLQEIRDYGREYARKWRSENPDKVKAANKKKYAKVKASPERYQKQLIATNKAKKKFGYKDLEQRYRDRSRDNLTDNYVKRLLLSHSLKYSYNDIPSELVEIKRKEKQLERELLKINNHGKKD